LPLLAMEATREHHFCDMCEMSFKDEKELVNHEEGHSVCNMEGCTFTASPEVSLQDSASSLITQFLFVT
jgi:hypothetical protein